MTEDEYLRNEHGIQIIGEGQLRLHEAMHVIFDMCKITIVTSVALMPRWALFSKEEAVHSPELLPAIRSVSWGPGQCAEHLWRWLQGEALPTMTAARLPERQYYNHKEPELAIYPVAPRMANGSPNEMRGDCYIFRRGWKLTGDEIAGRLYPVWAR